MIAEDQLKQKIAMLGASNDFVAVLAYVPPSTLSQALRGVKALTAERFRTVDQTLNEMQALQAMFDIPISWRDPEAIREKIDQMKRDQRRQQLQSAEETDRQVLAAVLVGEEPAQIATRFNISLTDLHSKIAAADQRWQDSIVSLRAAAL